MKRGARTAFGAQLKALREAAGFTQEELAAIAGVSVHAVSALERGQRRRPRAETVRALSAALELNRATRDALVAIARAPAHPAAVDELNAVSLPLPPTALLGRESDVQALRRRLADPAGRLITIVGPGGVGKTRLALELARVIADEGVTRVVLAPLAAIRDPGLAACAIAEALGLADISAADLPRRARSACQGQHMLIVLDNFEQVLDAAPLIAELLTAAPTLRLLVTSRAPLRVRGEREYALGPLALPAGAEAMSPAELALVPAIRLFVERVRDVQPEFCLTAANARTVTAICRRLDALPLALELAAPWMKVLTAEDLLRRLEQDVLLSAAGPRDLPARQQTMNATVAWSYQLLSPSEQRAFRRFGASPGRFSIEAAAAVLADGDGDSTEIGHALAAVAGLIDKSLLFQADTAVATRPLYQMLETIRPYAVLQLTAAGEHDRALDGLASYCAREAALAGAGAVGPSQAEWLDRVHDNLDNYRAALAWLIAGRRAAPASGIAWGLVSFWFIRGYAAEALWWYDEILKLQPLPAAAETRALVGAALMWYAQGQLDRARHSTERALALSRRTGDVGLVALTELVSGHVEYAVGDASTARDRFTASLEAFRAVPLPWGVGNALTGLASIDLATGHADQAERLLQEATLVLRQSGPWYLTLALYVRAVLAVRRGDPDQAIAWVRDSLTRIRQLHDKFAFVHAMVPLAAAAALKGKSAWAARILGARDAVIERTGVTLADTSLHELKDRVEREVRARLDRKRWARAYAAGRTASIAALLRDIDGALEVRR